MVAKLIKPYLPRSLFGRAVVILIVPVVFIQVVVGVVLIERLFQDVTRQMTYSMSLDMNHIVERVEDGGPEVLETPEVDRLLRDLEISVRLLPPEARTEADARTFWDISGITVISALKSQVDAG